MADVLKAIYETIMNIINSVFNAGDKEENVTTFAKIKAALDTLFK